MPKRKICVVTGTRAEYGLLYWLMKEIEADPALELQLVVTGTHLEPRFGMTVDVIERDGFRVDARVPIDLSDDSPAGVASAMGQALAGMAEAFTRLEPTIVVLLGDRYEILAAAEAAMLCRRVIAHIHGGEITEGAIDDAMRHAITKLAHLHFPSAGTYGKRIVQMGEDPAHVYVVGAPGLDNIESLDLLDRAALGVDLQFELEPGYFLVTFHPTTLSDEDPIAAARALIAAFDRFPDRKIIMTGVNADPGNRAIDGVFSAYAAANAGRVRAAKSLGQRRYLSTVKHADAVVGNSSSGLIEAPALGVPTVNIGDRQRGRLRASSVVDCGGTTDDIAGALTTAVSKAHRDAAKRAENPYGRPGASKRIKDVLARVALEGLTRKRFRDLAMPA